MSPPAGCLTFRPLRFAFYFFPFAFQTSLECLSERDEPGLPPLVPFGVDDVPLRVDLEAHIEPDRPDRRLVAEAKPDRGPQLAELDVGRVGEHVAGVDEPHPLNPPVERAAELDVENRLRISPDREPLLDRVGP